MCKSEESTKGEIFPKNHLPGHNYNYTSLSIVGTSVVIVWCFLGALWHFLSTFLCVQLNVSLVSVDLAKYDRLASISFKIISSHDWYPLQIMINLS